ncbi:type III-B CRISPR module RAMP protein Cmr1 [Tepiditoga spiralis]|uniref:Type III-B CRISPR module RAMP protein Cmr1 n=1 Tax=Tepiditoga spiralis TaxID=2108365 RepID=A0A7G1G9S5_9BACT|nr:type III-B CRISPR module RAMP protein Cmr1 [Tepiditoga spiralis]BBE31753.1 type III-B CRISPR module RAMP protein Cmr1 [Tepiditoga spiralis]
MQLLKLTLETTSPMFNGRDNNFVLLPQSIRGVMRYWFRACIPRTINIGRNYENLKKIEEDLFGSTERKSSFDVIVESNYQQSISKSIAGNVFSDFKYGIYGAESKRYLKEGTKINLTFVIKRNIDDLDYLLYYLMYLISNIGGIGMKSRNGFGSFLIIKKDEKYQKPSGFVDTLKKIDVIMQKYAEKLNLPLGGTIFNEIPDFPTLTKSNYKGYTSKQRFVNIQQLFKFLYKADIENPGAYIHLKKKYLRGAHTKRDSFVRSIKAIERSRPERIEYKQALLGLPINYRIMSGHHGNIRGGNYTLSGDERKASPVYISVHRILDEKKTIKYIYKIFIIKSKMSSNNNLKFKKKGEKITLNGYFNFDFKDIEKNLVKANLIKEVKKIEHKK